MTRITYFLASALFTVSLVCQCSETTVKVSAPEDLRCEYRINPLGIEKEHPRLSWIVPLKTRGAKQTAYQILAAGSIDELKNDSGGLWDSGRIQSDQSIHVEYFGKSLTSCTRAYWKVRTWDENGMMSAWSEPSFWETGLLDQDEWTARWIGYHCQSAPMFRRKFTLTKDIKQARIYICGLGYYELHINGSKVGDHVLDPGQTDYEERVFYVVYDVTKHLHPGKNVIGVILGNGWYNQAVVNEAKYGWGDVIYGDPRLIVQSVITNTDDSETLIVTDDSWKGSSGPILSDNVYAGETYDARLELPGWDAPGFDDCQWEQVSIVKPPGGVLVSQKLPPIKRMHSLTPQHLTQPKPGVYVYDMGQNFAGWTKLKVTAEKGTTIQLRFAETVFEDGMIDPASTGVGATHVIQTDKYTCKGNGPEEWEPRFTYHGFRYVEMTGFPGEPSLDNLEGIAVYTDVGNTGRFQCSDDMLNRIQRTALWTQFSNMHSLPEDCPAREKCGWLGDAHVTAEMTIYNFDVPLFWTKYIRDIDTNRRSRGGIVEDIAPGKRQEPGWHPDWGSAFIQIPWYMYLYYHDTAILHEQYDGMAEFLDSVTGLAKDHIVYEGYGDWCPPGSARPVDTPVELTSTAYYFFDVKIMAEVAKILGKNRDAERYNRLAETIRTSFNNHFYNAAKKTYGSQTGDCFTLYLGLVPEGDEQDVADSLARDIIDKHDGHHSTGVTGSLHLYWALGHFGHGDLAHKLLQNTTYPSVGYLFSQGATTFWESWGKRGGSLNHPMQGGFTVWFYQGIAGINPDPENPGFKHTIFRPPVRGNLDSAQARFRSPYGLITSEWSLTEENFNWNVSIPANTTATIYMPSQRADAVTESGVDAAHAEGVTYLKAEGGCSVYNIESGNYFFSCKN